MDIGVAWAAVVMLVSGRQFAITSWMAAWNETTIEGFYIGGNPYQSTVLENLRQLVGPLDVRLFLPVQLPRSLSGTSFPVLNKKCISTAEKIQKDSNSYGAAA